MPLVHIQGVLASLLAWGLLLAAPPDEGLRWQATLGCPGAERGATLVREALGGSLPSGVLVAVELSGGGGQHEATVRVGTASRTLRAAECETLARAAALVVAVSVDAVGAAALVSEPLDDGPEVPEPSPVAPATARPRKDADDVTDHSSSAIPSPTRSASGSADRGEREAAGRSGRHWLGAAGVVGRARIPALTGGARLVYAWQREVLRIETAASYDAPRQITYEEDPEVGGRFQSVALALRGCAVPSRGRLDVPLCAGLEGGPVFGRGVGVVQQRRPIGAWLAASVGAGARVGLGSRVALTTGLDLLLGVRRPAFHVGERATLLRSPGAGLRLAVGLEIGLR